MPRYYSFVSVGRVPGWIVPQEIFESQNGGHAPGPIISFTQNMESGVLLSTAIHSSFKSGTPENTSMSDGMSIADIRTQDGRIKLRILWPGCQPYDKSIIVTAARGGHGGTRQLTKAELAHKVAAAVQDFLHTHQRASNYATDGNQDWAPSRFNLDRITLHELHHVSRGSYQPVLTVST